MTLTDNPGPSRWLTWLNPWAARWVRSLVDMQEAQGWTWLIKQWRKKKNPVSICLRSEVTLPCGNVCHTSTGKGLNWFISHCSPQAPTLMWWVSSTDSVGLWRCGWDDRLKHAMLLWQCPTHIMSDERIITLRAGESVTSLETPEGYFTQRHHIQWATSAV